MKPSHRRFCYHYLKCLNASEAARKAGYSETNAADIGSRLLKKESIKTYISNEINKALGAEKESLKKRVLDELQVEAFGESHFTDETKGGTITRANPNKMKALELLSKYAAILAEAPAQTNIYLTYPAEFKEDGGND